jgi:hypothetical protein
LLLCSMPGRPRVGGLQSPLCWGASRICPYTHLHLCLFFGFFGRPVIPHHHCRVEGCSRSRSWWEGIHMNMCSYRPVS